MRKLHEAKPDQLVQVAEGTVDEAYKYVADAFGYEILGKDSDEYIDAFRAEPGALRDRFWEKFAWTKPVDETASCWWVANAAEADKTQTVQLKCKSVACLRLELQTARVATVSELKKEWERRESDNEMAVQRIRQNASLWKHVCSLGPEKLLRPSAVDLDIAQDTAAALKRMVATRETGNDKLHVEAFAEDLVTRDAIRRDRFSLTPEGLFDEMARTAAALIAG